MRFLSSLFCIITLWSALSLHAQTFSKYWIEFTDKNNSSYSISNPSAFLSQRAIDRRIKQNIAIQENDLPVNSWYIDSITNKGAKVLNRSKWFNAVTIYTTDTAILSKIKNLSFVKGASPVAMFKTSYDKNEYNKFTKETFQLLENNETASTNGSTYNYGSASNQITMISGDILHSLGYDGKGMVIAVLDAGFKNADKLIVFDSLRANNQILGTWDFVEGNDSVYDDDNHGMEVLDRKSVV